MKFVKSIYDKEFREIDIVKMCLLGKISDEFKNRFGNEEVMSILIDVALHMNKGLRKGLVRDTLDYFKNGREMELKMMK